MGGFSPIVWARRTTALPGTFTGETRGAQRAHPPAFTEGEPEAPTGPPTGVHRRRTRGAQRAHPPAFTEGEPEAPNGRTQARAARMAVTSSTKRGPDVSSRAA